MKQPLNQIIVLFVKLIGSHKKFDNSLAYSMPLEYFINLVGYFRFMDWKNFKLS